MAENDEQLNLRLRPDLKKRIKLAALSSGRSINSEVVYRLEQSLNEIPPSIRDSNDPVLLINDKIMQQVADMVIEKVTDQVSHNIADQVSKKLIENLIQRLTAK
ncbi:Arc family DNA-binding protein [Acinetobacter sp. P1(2025)]|uniref:Arc family DNA-binding protein n=1 Tax=Acinetobacter sp. P1(2025) TaxID=3446120 RepID=UPI003F53BBCA